MRRKAFFSLNEDIGREGKKVSPIHEKPLEIERWNVVLIPSDLCHGPAGVFEQNVAFRVAGKMV